MVSRNTRTNKLQSREDCTGRKIYAGDLVRVVGLPDLSRMPTRTRQESEPVFRYLRGKYKKILSFGEDGLAEIEFRIMKGELSGLHICLARTISSETEGMTNRSVVLYLGGLIVLIAYLAGVLVEH